VAREIALPTNWLNQLHTEFEQPYMQQLRQFLQHEKQQGKTIYPAGKDIFAAFNATDFDQVKVVILGQDPYHGAGQAHGLSFSVPPSVALPPSLINIYKELHNDLGYTMAEHGCLTHWAQQGVLLLNSVLTVEHGLAASHQGRGWERFTDQVITHLNQQREHIVFMLWGAYAQRKGAVIDRQKHLVLTAPHPSPLSVYRGFFGCKHFSKANQYLQQQGIAPIDWQIR
jgi:uracil-DNA glycosylase